MAYGAYNNFGVGSFFTSIDTSTLIYALFFLLVLFITFKSLSKIFREQPSIAAVLSIALSTIAVWLLSKANFNFEYILYDFGLSNEFLQSTIPWVLLVAMVIIIWTLGFGMLFMILGAILFLLGITDIVYERGLAIVLGIIFFIIGFIIQKRKKIKIGLPDPKKIKDALKWARLAVVVEGRRIFYPTFRRISMSIPPGGESRISVENFGRSNLIWKIKTYHGISLNDTRGTLPPKTSNGIKVFSDSSNRTKIIKVIAWGKFGRALRQKIIIYVESGTSSSTMNRKNELIKAAKEFYNWAKSQPNPKFVGSWAMFISFLKNNRHWGKSEKEIITTLGITQNEFVSIFNRYGKV